MGSCSSAEEEHTVDKETEGWEHDSGRKIEMENIHCS